MGRGGNTQSEPQPGRLSDNEPAVDEHLRRTTELVLEEVERQDRLHRPYRSDRDDVRLALCTVEDELEEALDAWRKEKGRPSNRWPKVAEEMRQSVAVGMRLLRTLDQREALAEAESKSKAEGPPICGYKGCQNPCERDWDYKGYQPYCRNHQTWEDRFYSDHGRFPGDV
jgi:hypothetical protein